VNLIRGGGRRFNEFAGTDVGRLAGISDGIFAVGMTLLVLGLTVPTALSVRSEGDLWHELVLLGPSVLVYTMSSFSWLQLAFLFAVTLVPFSTGLLARFPTFRVALVEYWLNIVLLGMTLLVTLHYGLRKSLFDLSDKAEVVPLMRGRILIAQSLYAIATATCIVFPTWVSIALIFLVQLNYVIAPRIPILHRF
jgi:uncharacterized membrane protein